MEIFLVDIRGSKAVDLDVIDHSSGARDPPSDLDTGAIVEQDRRRDIWQVSRG